MPQLTRITPRALVNSEATVGARRANQRPGAHPGTVHGITRRAARCRTVQLSDIVPRRRANGYQVVVTHFAYRRKRQRYESLGAPRRCDELDLDCVRRVDVHNGAQVTPPETMRRQVFFQDDNVEHLQCH
jgi:hypothetical protein